jgi:hypothetical protein
MAIHANSLGASTTVACPVIIRRRYPADWEAGLPEDVQSFASHYEVYLQVETGEDNEVRRLRATPHVNP